MATDVSTKQNQIESSRETQYRSPLKEVVYKFRRDKFALFGLSGLIFMILLSIFGPILSPHDILSQNYDAIRQAPSIVHPFGTDNIGRDTLTRTMAAGRTSITIGLGSITFAAVIGIMIGSVAGYTRSDYIDETFMRMMDVFISIPAIILGIAVMGILGTDPFKIGFLTIGNLEKLILVIGIVYTPRFARVTRGAVLREREKDYVKIAKLEGSSDAFVITSEILPNILAPLLVMFSYRTGSAMIVAAGLGFLGIGVQPPTPSWGVMLATGRDFIATGDYWLVIFPGLALAFTIICLNIVGDGLRDALDPDVKAID